MLRDAVGTEAFWRGIREYYRQHLNATATTDDLRLVMERESGQDLAWFFRQWLNRSGVPAIQGTWRYDATAKQVVVTVTQTQAGELYRFPLDVAVSQTASVPPRAQRVDITRREASFTLPAESEPAAVTLDPGVWLLADFGPFTKTPAASGR